MNKINAQTIINAVMQAHAIAPTECTCGDFITFKTSERGTHRIINDKAHLQRFADAVRKNAAAFGGGLIREAKTAPAVSYASKTISLYKQLIEDQDWHAALQLADEKLSPLFFFGTHGKAYMQVAPIPCDFEPRFVSTLNEDGKWSVCCPVSMLGLDSLIGNKRSRKAQIDAAEQHLQVIDPEKKESVFADAHTRPVDQSAARAKWMADHGIIDDAEIDARIDAQAAQDVAEVVAQAVAVSAIAEAMAPSAEEDMEMVTCEAGESESNGASIAQFIHVAADSVGTLRKIDVSRVMDEAPTQYRQELAAYIQYNRPDLAQEVSDVLEESTHTTTPAVISGTVTSPVAISKEYRYAMVNRPFSIGTAPTDGIIRMDARPSQGDPHHDMARHGIAVYNRQLTDKETIDYELAPIADDAMMENLCAAVTHDIAEYATEYVSMASDDWINFEAHVINTMKRVTTSFRVSIESNRAFADMVLTALTTATRAPSTPAAGTVEQPATRPVESTEDAPRIIQQRPSDWPYASSGWSTVGGGRNAPGYASERSAKIDLSKNPEWKERDARIVAFKWNDGGICGCSPYWKTETRYAILVKKMPEVAEVAPIEDTSPVVESAEITAPAPEPVPVVEIEATTPAAEIQIEPVAHVVGTEYIDTALKFAMSRRFLPDARIDGFLTEADISTTSYGHVHGSEVFENNAFIRIECVGFDNRNGYDIIRASNGKAYVIVTYLDNETEVRKCKWLREHIRVNPAYYIKRMAQTWGTPDTTPDDHAKFNIRAKSGAWFACVYMVGAMYGLRFEAICGPQGCTTYATHAERMQALEAMARATTPPATPPDGGQPIASGDAPTGAPTPPVAQCTPDTPVAVSRAKPEHDLQVGDVVRCSWGYDQTNVNHYQIIALIGKRTVEVRELAEHKESTGDMTGRVAPVWGEFIGEAMRRTVDRHGNVNILREKFGRASKIEPVAVVHGVRCYASTGYSSYA